VAVAEAAKSFMTAFPDMEVLVDDLREGANGLEYHWKLVGTNSGPGGSGKRVRISGFEEWKFEDGLIRESQGHFDEVEYARQLRDGA
jgi:predicted ester cyclase